VRQIVQLIPAYLLLLLGSLAWGKLWGATGQFHRDGPVGMALVSAANGLLPGKEQWIGWLIQREEGWHTYWEYPGNVGLTPDLEWSLPAGFSAGDLQFPFPKRVRMAGVKAYGHHGETLYLLRLKVPQLEAGEEVQLVAQARWMACSNVCLPSYAQLRLSLPVVSKLQPDKNWQPRFAEFLKNRPLKLPGEWNAKAVELGQFTKLTLGHPFSLSGRELYFFGADRLVCSDVDPLCRTTQFGTELLLPKPPWPEENPTTLSGLLQVRDEDGAALHYTLRLPLD